jgi:hypothetical protein
MPPCGVYLDNRFQGLAVTPKAMATRSRQIGDIIAKSVQPDVIAFQEVFGSPLVRLELIHDILVRAGIPGLAP